MNSAFRNCTFRNMAYFVCGLFFNNKINNLLIFNYKNNFL